MHNPRSLLLLTLLSGCILACAGGLEPESGCGAMGLSPDAVDGLLASWEGRYLMPDYCPVGDCPPNDSGTTTLHIDADRRVLEWVHDGTAFKSVDLGGACITGVLTGEGEGLGGRSLALGKISSEEMVLDLRYDPRHGASMNINWPDPGVTKNTMAPGTKVWSGRFGLTDQDVVDVPPATAPEVRKRSISDPATRDEIWLTPVWIPGAK